MSRLSHHWWPGLLIPLYPCPYPLDGLFDTIAGQGAHGQYPRVADGRPLVSLHDLLDQALLYSYRLDTVLAILLISKDQQRYALRFGVLQDILEDEPTLI